ncbi:hypothetical protein [Peptococcus niger]|uniref:histidine kinase n=1 Tax=Peptococcus niger TaxID=2741 RepID=A0A1G6TGR7_PEPNI|nr:hypothetical protein [Peptococcus niger]SDD28209.1 hypothetical protein SAMN04489866_102145 [Peptococcus niger]
MTLMDLSRADLALLFSASLFLLTLNLSFFLEMLRLNIKNSAFFLSMCFLCLSFFSAQTLTDLATERGQLYLVFDFLSPSLLSLLLLAVFVGDLFLFQKIKAVKRRTLGRNAIKETMDNLPDGICFSKKDGTPLLVNKQMQQISYDVFGKMLANDLACASYIQERKIRPMVEVLNESPLVIKAENKVWLISILDYDEVKETVAYNITQEWAMVQEIEEKNDQIRCLNANLKAYKKKIAEYTQQKEVLQAKIHIHDRIGQSLIFLCRYLKMPQKSKEDREKLVTLWKESLLMFDQKRPTGGTSAWEKLQTAAQDIGVTIQVSGHLPEDEKDQDILVDIVHEALNNAIRHGEAKNLWVDLSEDESTVYGKIRNDGKPTPETIAEKGGLKNIRHRLNLLGGKMSITTRPQFQLAFYYLKGGYHELQNHDR